MSSPEDVAALVETFKDFIALTYVETSILGMFVYDYILTLSREVNLVWKGPFRLPTVLFIMTRYFVILGIVYNVAGDPDQPLVCNSIQHLIDSLDIFARGAMLAVCIARTYALHQERRAILVILGAVALAILAINAAISAVLHLWTQALAQYVNVVRSALQQSFDLAVIALTLYKTRWAWKLQRIAELKQQKSVTTLVLRDGAVYFAALFTTELLNTCLSFLASDTLKEVATAYALPLQSILTSRFLLDLRYMTKHPNATDVPLTLTSFRVGDPDALQPNHIVRDFGGSVYSDTMIDDDTFGDPHVVPEELKLDDMGTGPVHVIRPEREDDMEITELAEMPRSDGEGPIAAA